VTEEQTYPVGNGFLQWLHWASHLQPLTCSTKGSSGGNTQPWFWHH